MEAKFFSPRSETVGYVSLQSKKQVDSFAKQKETKQNKAIKAKNETK
jgi:hypothetical protein